jgi:hypothetical protein
MTRTVRPRKISIDRIRAGAALGLAGALAIAEALIQT